jgi:hypothetical protein
LSGILASLQAATLRQGGRQRKVGVSTTETSLNKKEIHHLPYPKNRRKHLWKKKIKSPVCWMYNLCRVCREEVAK